MKLRISYLSSASSDRSSEPSKFSGRYHQHISKTSQMEGNGNPEDNEKGLPEPSTPVGRKLSVRDPSLSEDQGDERRFGTDPTTYSTDINDGNGRNEMSLADLRQRELEYELQLLRLRRQRFANEAQLQALQVAVLDTPSTSSSALAAHNSRNVLPLDISSVRNNPLWDIRGTEQAMESTLLSSIHGLPPESGTLGSSMALRRELELRRRMAYGATRPSASLDTNPATLQSASAEALRETNQVATRGRETLEAALRREIQERSLLLEAATQPATAASRLWENNPTQRITFSSSLVSPTPRDRELLLDREATGRELQSGGLARATASANPSLSEPQPKRQARTSTKPVLPLSLAIAADREMLSPYQQLVRQSLEFFQLDMTELQRSDSSQVQGLEAGQVGVRCKYCAKRPLHWRGRGSFSFPNRLARVYQAAQNVANNHLRTVCPEIPEAVKEELEARHSEVAPMRGGGKKYWEEACRSVGLHEQDGVAGVWLLESVHPPSLS